MKLSVTRLVLSALFLPLLLSGCGHKEGGSNGAKLSYPTDHTKEPVTLIGKYGGNLTYEGLSDPKTFNWWVADDADSAAILSPIYDSLEGRSSFTYKFMPRLAELPKISADGLTYTYTLRPGLKWSDGQPLTTDDVIFTLDVLFDPKIQTLSREGMLIDVVHPDGTITRQPFGYKKVDARTIVFTLPQKYAPAESIFAGIFPAPKHKLESVYKAGQFNSYYGINTPPADLVASGPFVMSQYAAGQRIIYKPNPYFWKKDAAGHPLPYLDTFTYLITPDINTMVLKFRSGDGDAINMPASAYPDLKKGEAAGDYTVVDRGPSWGFNFMSFNLNPASKQDKSLLPLFQDVRFRQAVSHAVNRQRICDDVFLGLAKPLYSPETPADPIWYDPNVKQYAYDLKQSKDLLTQAGCTSAGGKLLYRGTPVKFTMYTNVENDQRKQMMTIIANDLSTLGMTVTPVAINFNDLIRRVDTPPYDWQSTVGGFIGVPEPHDGSNIWRSSGPSHEWWPKQAKPATPWEAECDKTLIAADHEMNPVKRKALYDHFQEILAEQQPFIFTVCNESFSAMRDHYGNVKPSGLYSLSGDVVWNVEEIFDTKATRSTR